MIRPSADNISRHLRHLVGERNPYTSSKTLQSTSRYIAKQFLRLDLRVWEEDIEFDGCKTCNIVGVKQGTVQTPEIFVVGAHYDTVTGTPGADDNASAVAALLELAWCLDAVPLKTSLVFAAFTLEEYGFVGSRYFLRKAQAGNIPIRGMISLEMLGFRNRQPGSQRYPAYVDSSIYPDTGDFIAVVGNDISRNLTLSLVDEMQKASPELKVEQIVVPGRGDSFADGPFPAEVRLSDHSPFWDEGCEAVMITDTAFFRNPNYHKSTDTADTLDMNFIRDICAGIAGFLEFHLR